MLAKSSGHGDGYRQLGKLHVSNELLFAWVQKMWKQPLSMWLCSLAWSKSTDKCMDTPSIQNSQWVTNTDHVWFKFTTSLKKNWSQVTLGAAAILNNYTRDWLACMLRSAIREALRKGNSLVDRYHPDERRLRLCKHLLVLLNMWVRQNGFWSRIECAHKFPLHVQIACFWWTSF